MSIQSNFTSPGQVSGEIGRGPVFYRLNCIALPAGQVDFYFGKSGLGPDPRNVLMLTGTWTGQVDIEFSVDKETWTAIPGESYTANTARFFSG